MASRCAVYADRYGGMPIRMMDGDGRVVLDFDAGTFCGLDMIGEGLVILKQIAEQRGCSLTVRTVREEYDGRRDGQVRLQYDPNPQELLQRWCESAPRDST